MKIMRLLTTLFGLFATSSLFADHVLVPPLVARQGMHPVFSWLIVLVGFVIELSCVYLAVRREFFKVLLATLSMNAVSVLFGTLAWYFLALDKFIDLFNIPNTMLQFITFSGFSLENVFLLLLFFILTLAINIALEMWVVFLFFPDVSKMRLVMWLLVAHILSIFIGLMGFGVHQYYQGATMQQIDL